MIVKKAKYSDMYKILPLIKSFIEESNWSWEYDKDNSKQTIIDYITDDSTNILYVENEDGLYVGFALIACDNEFHKEKIGYVTKFYISEQARGTNAGRLLIDTCNKWFDMMGCANVFATATANIESQAGLYKNLMGKFGFNNCGETLMRNIK